MARGITRIRNETSLRSLAERVYDISGPSRAENLRKAESALLKANPQLRRANGFAAGTVIIVPEVGLDRTGSVELPSADLDGALNEAAARIQQVAGEAKNGFSISQDQRKTALANLSDERFMAELVKSDRNAAKLANQAQDTLQKQDAAEEEAMARLRRSLSEASKEIDRLQRLTKGR